MSAFSLVQKPIKRSAIRKYLGKLYYRIKKNIYRYMSHQSFASDRQNDSLPICIFKHQSILLRKLKDVDMYMQYNKIDNLRIALQCLDGIVIKPQQVLSYWRQIGRPTASKGYKLGMILHDGGFFAGIGGGLCQLSNLIYWMTLHTPLTVIERWRHGYDVFPDSGRTLPFGSGATCAYPAIDLQIANYTDQSFQLRLRMDDEFLRGAWYCERGIDVTYEVFERDHMFQGQMSGGYTRHNKIFRTVIDKKSQSSYEEFITENNAWMMYNPMLMAS